MEKKILVPYFDEDFLNAVTINPTWALWLIKCFFYLEYICFYKNTKKHKIYLEIKSHTETSVKIKTTVMEL